MNIPKDKQFSEWFNSVVSEAALADLRYNVKGFVVFRPWSVKTMKLMYAAYEAELEARGHQPALFPALIPESNFKIEGEHVEGFTPQVFWVSEAGGNRLEEKLAMRPTSETAMYQMYSLWIQGLADLPMKIYQSCQVWRYETKATKPFIRSREFHWIEAHDCFATETEARAQVREDMEMTEAVVHRQFGLPFVFFQRPEWDKFPGAIHTYAADTLMPDGRVLQLPSTHLLGQNFSKAFNVTFQNEKGERDFVWQTCYGPAISRIYGALFSVHGDDRGLVLPFDFAPVQVAIVPIIGKDKDGAAILAYGQKLASALRAAGLRVQFDDRPQTPGFKYNHWELRGVPIRIEIGQKETDEQTLTVVPRDCKPGKGPAEPGQPTKKLVPLSSAIDSIRSEGSALSKRLLQKADAYFHAHQSDASDMAALSAKLSEGGLVRVPFCSMSKQDGKPCADEIKAKMAGDVRGIKYPAEPEPSSQNCIQCGKPATCWAYVARQY
ncbi:MAG: proline--tRNA ligase [Candidatus Micrarchaeota archaeon]|nr:proline--tRNA ligase [Candidatus Micrarchaeota archaeon]